MEMISQFFLRFQTAFSRPTTQWSEGRPALDFHKGTLFRRGFAQPLDCPTNSKYSIFMLTGYIEFTSCGTEDLGMSHILWNAMFCGIHSVNGLLDPFGFSCLCVVVLRCCFGLYKLWKAQNLVLFYQQETVSAGSDSNENNCKILTGFDMSWSLQITLNLSGYQLPCSRLHRWKAANFWQDVGCRTLRPTTVFGRQCSIQGHAVASTAGADVLRFGSARVTATVTRLGFIMFQPVSRYFISYVCMYIIIYIIIYI